MNKEMQKCLNEIMQNTHNLVSVLTKSARLEAKENYDKREKILDDITIKNKRQKLVELYDELSEWMEIVEEDEISSDPYISTIEISRDAALMQAKANIRAEIDTYIELNYTDMQFITNNIGGVETYSIYEGTDQEIIRKVEYDLYMRNLNAIELAKQIENKEIYDLDFSEKAGILESISTYKGFKKSGEIFDNVIKKMKDPNSTLKFESEQEKEDILLNLIMYKKTEEYREMNEEDNGILSKNINTLRFINLTSNETDIQLLLGISKDDYEGKVNKIILEYIGIVKATILPILKQKRKKVLNQPKLPRKNRKIKFLRENKKQTEDNQK